MTRYLLPIAVFAVFIPVFLIGLNRDPSALPSPFLGKPAPSFSLPTLEDERVQVSSDDYKGQLALVNVWATWCGGCRQEHGYLMQIAARNEIPIYGLNWRDNRSEAVRWLADLGDPYVASGFDGDGRVGIDWGVYGAPETFLIAPDGTVAYKHLGPINDAIWQREFVPRISELSGDSS
jgi:cytochrome c biogenesis protein CcmG/thiol:disulfide interchange protein DsbE